MNKGFSIIEFLIAMTLGTLLVATVSSVYISNKSTFRVQEGLARLQENARFTTYFLNHELRMVGFQGCGGQNFVTMNNLIKAPTNTLLYDTPLFGFDGLTSSFSPVLSSNLTGKVAPDTDAIEIRMATNTNVQLKDDMNLANNPILVYDRLGIQAGEVVMISNCHVGDIFIAGGNTNATSITHTVTNNTSNSLSTAYTAGAQVMRYIYHAFYIKNTGRTNADGQPVYALIRQDVNGNEVEIVEGIEQMRVRYGVDTNDDKTADVYQTATEVNSGNNWNNVISIKLNLLFATVENVQNTPQTYQFNGETITPTDRKLRREWQSVISIRNRALPS